MSTDVQWQVEKAQEWFEIECPNGQITPKLKVSLAREIQKCMGDDARVKIALLSLVLAGQVANPLSFSKADVENALWLVRDLRIGFSDDAPIAVEFFQ